MKHEAIAKINKFGKISTVFARVAKILMMIGAGLSLIAAIVIGILPNDMASVTVNGTTVVDINLESFGGVPADQWSKIEEEITSGSGSVNGTAYGVVDAEVDEHGFLIHAQSEEITYHLHDVIPYILIGMISLILLVITLWFIEKLCIAFRDCESPFEENVIKKMRNLAIALVPWALVDCVSSAILTGYFRGAQNISLKLNAGTIIVVLVILALTFVFKYGAELQRESDETL